MRYSEQFFYPEYLMCIHVSPNAPFRMLLAPKSADNFVAIVVSVVFCHQSKT